MVKGSETIVSKAITNCSETKIFVPALDISVSPMEKMVGAHLPQF
jgi:hypothetical protein